MGERLISDIGHGRHMHIKQTKIKSACCWENNTMYERVKSAIAGQVTDTNFCTENAMFILFCLRKGKNRHNIKTAVVHEKQFYFSLLYSLNS